MADAITAFVSVPINGTLKHRLLAFGGRVTMLKTATTGVELLLNSPSGTGHGAGCEMLAGSARWATTLYENRVYFTNPNTPIHVVTDQPYVNRLGFGEIGAANFPDLNPKAKYIDTFFDHLVIANVDYKGRFPNRLQWSHLYDFNIFDSSRKNEADHYDMLESPMSKIGGITGIAKLGVSLFTYTSTGIYASQYVGLPSIIRTEQVIPDVGNDFQYGLIATERLHFFISELWNNIFVFNGEVLTPIGDPIIDFFFDDLSTDLKKRQATWGYMDREANELVWCYKSILSAGLYDKEIVYNLLFKKWYARSCNDLTAFHPGARTSQTIEGLGTTDIGVLTGPIEDLDPDLKNFGKIWGDGTGHLVTEDAVTLQDEPVPYLETNDLFYDDFTTIKEIENILIHAQLGTAASIDVYVATRNHVDDAVTYAKQAQTWTPTLRETRLTLPRTSGRIIRYKFVPVIAGGQTSVDNFAWTNFTEFVYNAKAEK